MSSNLGSPRKSNWQPKKKRSMQNWQLYAMLVVPIIYYIVFRYLPMFGNIIAFRRYRAGGNLFGSGAFGLKYFKSFIKDASFWRAFKNTLILNVTYLAFRFPLTLIFALLINEIRNLHWKKFVQTVSYLPHFISMVIVCGMIKELVATNGPLNAIVHMFGGESIQFLAVAKYFVPIFTISGVWHITLPSILPTITTLLILDIGGLVGSGGSFEKVFLLYNPMIYSSADIISTYVYRMGIGSGNYSYATAVGLFEGLINLVLLTIANLTSKKLTDSSLF